MYEIRVWQGDHWTFTDDLVSLESARRLVAAIRSGGFIAEMVRAA